MTAVLPQFGVGLNTIFETHIYTTDLARAMEFYGQTLGLEQAFIVPEREVAFYWIGGHGNAMLGVWGVPQQEWRRSHFGFTIGVEQIDAALAGLRAADIPLLDFWANPTADPSVIGWMPACNIYFNDPDGNSLELIAMLPDEPQPAPGITTLSAWRADI